MLLSFYLFLKVLFVHLISSIILVQLGDKKSIILQKIYIMEKKDRIMMILNTFEELY